MITTTAITILFTVLLVFLAFCYYKSNKSKGSWGTLFERRTRPENYYITKWNDGFKVMTKEPVIDDCELSCIIHKTVDEAKEEVYESVKYYIKRDADFKSNQEKKVVWDGKTVTQ